MKNYVFVYFSDVSATGAPMEDVMKAWNAWFGGLGDKLVDGGNPFNDGGQLVEKSGVSAIEKNAASGYSIVKAGSMKEAVEVAKGCPVLDGKGGAVRVYETMPM